jgi:hydrogenase maturation protease
LLKPLLVLCLGNEIVSDDGFGPAVARLLHGDACLSDQGDVIFAPVAGFHLLDLMQDRKRVLIVDTIVTGKAEPGTVHVFSAGLLTPSRHLTTSHQISLPTALELGQRLGYNMPTVVDVVAVEAQDLETISEEMTPSVRNALTEALEFIRKWAAENAMEEALHGEKREEICTSL